MDSNIVNFPRNKIAKPRALPSTTPDLTLEIRKLSDLIIDLTKRNMALEDMVKSLQKRLLKLAVFVDYKE